MSNFSNSSVGSGILTKKESILPFMIEKHKVSLAESVPTNLLSLKTANPIFLESLVPFY